MQNSSGGATSGITRSDGVRVEQGGRPNLYGETPVHLRSPKRKVRLFHHLFRALRRAGLIKPEDERVVRDRERAERENLLAVVRSQRGEIEDLQRRLSISMQREQVLMEENSNLYDLLNTRV